MLVPVKHRKSGRSVSTPVVKKDVGRQRGDVNVTTLKNSAAAGRTRSIKLAVLTTVLSFGFAGCETGNTLLGGANTPAPQAALTEQPAASASQTARVEIAPIIGAPEAVARDLQSQLTGSIERNKISVVKAPGGKGEYVLRGYIVAAREKAGSKISYIWDVTDQAGKRANRITGEEFANGPPGKDPWSSITPQIIQSIADKTATQFASWLPGRSGTPVASAAPAMTPAATGVATATAAPKMAQAAIPAVANGVTPAATPAALTTTAAAAASGPGAAASTTGSIESGGLFTTIVPTVTGAPGDGSSSLTGAIQRELSKNGVSLTSNASPQTYKVEGKVAVGQGKDGKQPIQIDWNVIDPKGKKLGTVSQKNEVPQGSLDGAWGKTADLAASAAAQGILKLLPQQKASN